MDQQTIISGLLHKINPQLSLVVNVRMAKRKFEASPAHYGVPATACFNPANYPGLDVIDGLAVAIFSDVPLNHVRIVAGAKEMV